MEYNYQAAARRLDNLRSKVRSIRQADGSYKDVGLSEPQEDKTAEKEFSLQKSKERSMD